MFSVLLTNHWLPPWSGQDRPPAFDPPSLGEIGDGALHEPNGKGEKVGEDGNRLAVAKRVNAMPFLHQRLDGFSRRLHDGRMVHTTADDDCQVSAGEQVTQRRRRESGAGAQQCAFDSIPTRLAQDPA